MADGVMPGSCRAVTSFPDSACADAGAAHKERLCTVYRIPQMEGKCVVGVTVKICACSALGSA